MSTKKNYPRNTYKYGNGEYLTIGKLHKRFETAKVIEERPKHQIPEKKKSKFGWPENIRDYETNFVVNEQKFKYLLSKMQQERSLKLFLSSPFDGCGEERKHFMRMLETLRARCAEQGIFLSVVDFRTGITDHTQTQTGTVQTCLRALDEAGIVLGFFGARYGSTTGNSSWLVDDLHRCAQSYPFLHAYMDRSVTEIEWQHAFLHGDNFVNPQKPVSFFFLSLLCL
jgi:hypothetical protein